MLDLARPHFYTMNSFLSTYQGPKQAHDRNKTTDRFFDLLEQQDFTTALLHVMQARGLLKSVASYVLVSSTSSNRHDHRTLALQAFVKVDKERPRGPDGTLPEYTLSSFLSTLADVRREFRLLKTRANDYLNHQPVQDWVQGNDNPDQVVAENMLARRRSAINNNVWNPKTSVLNHRNSSINHWIWPPIRGVTPYQLLLDQDFDRLLQIHRFYIHHSPWDWHFVPGASN
jgi:hypothetical protein